MKNDKFHFKSIDGLMDTTINTPKRSYLYNETPDMKTGIPKGYDAKALEYSVNNSVHVQKKLQLGAYSTRIITFDPYDCKYVVTYPNAGNTPGAPSGEGNEKNLKLAGKNLPVLNKEFNREQPGKEFSRTTFCVLDNEAKVLLKKE